MLRFACSVALRGGRGAADKRHWPVWGALAVLLPHWVCPHSWCVLSALHCSGSKLLYMEQALCCERFQFSGTPQKCRLGWACVLCLPCPSSSGRQELHECTLPGCGGPSPLRGPGSGAPCVCSGELASSRNPPGRCQPFRISESLWLETGSLFAVWSGCHLWSRVCPFPLLPASCLQRGWAGPQPASSSLELLNPFVLRMASSVFG